MDWNELRTVVEICSPILGGLGFIYFRLEKGRKEDQRHREKQRAEDQRHWEKQRAEDKAQRDDDQKHWQWLFNWAHQEIERS